MQLVKITSNTVITGIGAVIVGEKHKVDKKTASILFAAGKAVPVELKPSKVSIRVKKTEDRSQKK